jgi:predicted transcriptional regulator
MPKKQPIDLTDVHLDPETQARVNAMARVLGRTPEGFVISALEHQLLNGPHRETYLAIKAGLEQAPER